MTSEDIALLQDMVESAELASSYVDGLTVQQFDTNQMVQDAVSYRIGIIGEAARDISSETAELIPLDWRGIRGMRNRLFHGYREVDLNDLWKTATTDLPHLLVVIRKLLQP
ncbi:MAG TPA: HepT-like ribonuclease domain-containing protein [Thermoanaerobaculia bacterium]|nr:HepT-like ribonuclease domain-containing protein [Thermoanaerobaculia bacterium]